MLSRHCRHYVFSHAALRHAFSLRLLFFLDLRRGFAMVVFTADYVDYDVTTIWQMRRGSAAARSAFLMSMRARSAR